MLLFTVKDHESQTFITPFSFATKRDAIEGFRIVCNDEKAPYSKFPKDYTLMALGEFDEKTGLYKTHEPTTIINATELVKQKEE